MILRKLLGQSQGRTGRDSRSNLASRTTGYKVSETPGQLWGSPTSSAGVHVDEVSSLSLSGVFAAANLLSRVVGSLPLSVYREKPGGGKDVAKTDPAYRLLHTQPNAEMTAVTFRRVLDFHRLMWGNAYAEIQWAGTGRPAALWLTEPWRVRPQRDQDGVLFYLIDGHRRVAIEDMLHVPLVSFDGTTGRSFVDFALDSLGLGMASQEFAGRFFANGARPGGVLKHPGTPDERARKKFRESWNESHSGSANANRVAVLWGGWEYSGADGTFSPKDAQLLESRRFSTEEVARWFNVPPHLLADLSRATFSNIEEQGLNFVVYSIGPVLVDYEQEYDRKLLDPPTTFSKHNLAGLLRGNMSARASFYTALFHLGALSTNDILELEDRNPVDGGDTRFVPMNMAPLTKAAMATVEVPGDKQADGHDVETPPAAKGDPAASGDVQATALNGAQILALLSVAEKQTGKQLSKEAARSLIKASFPALPGGLVDSIVSEIEKYTPPTVAPTQQPATSPATEQPPALGAIRLLLIDTASRLLRKEVNAARRAAKEPAKLFTWLDEFYSAHAPQLADALHPSVRALHALAGRDVPLSVTRQIADGHCAESRRAIEELSGTHTRAEFPAAAERLFESWQTRPAMLADTILETFHAGSQQTTEAPRLATGQRDA